jgi:hypothetical protein
MEPEISPLDPNRSIGCGLAGCAGGLVLGLLGGGLLLALLALGFALDATVPPPPRAAPSPDLRLTLSEDFLGRALQESAGEPVNVDILPGNQIRARFQTELEMFGAPSPVQFEALFELQLIGPRLAVALLDAQLVGVDVPLEMTDLLDDDLPAINEDVNQVVQEVSSALGTDVILTGLGSDETTLWFEAREAP